MLLIDMFWEFFKIGLFAVGGGMATLPFLHELANSQEWFSIADVSNMLAISESTPGPIGINMATYVGYMNSGFLGAIIAPLGEITPSVIIITIIAGVLKKFKGNKFLDNLFYGLRAASCALIAFAGLGVAKVAFLNNEKIFYPGIVMAVLLYFAIKKFKWHPVVYIAISAVIGIIFKFQI